MANFQIPRAQRRVEDPSEVFRGRAQAPTAATEATQQLGRAIAGAGVNIARISAANERMARETALNRSNNASNLVQEELTQFVVDELAKVGSNTEGNTEDFKEVFNASLQRHTSELSDEGKILTNLKIAPYFLSTNKSLATHQSNERRAETISNLNQTRDKALLSIGKDPSIENIMEQRAIVGKELNQYTEFIGKEAVEDRMEEMIQDSIETAVIAISSQDPEAAGFFLEQNKEQLPVETIKSLETDIRKQTKLQKDELEAARKESVQNFTNKIIDLAPSGELTLTQLHAAPEWAFANPSERKNLESIVNKSDPLKKSDNIIRADFITKIATAPLDLTEKDFNDAHGNGLSSNDYKAFIGEWQTKIEEIRNGTEENPLQDQYKKQAYRLIEFMRKDTAFIEPGGFFAGQSPEELQENDLKAAQAVNSLARYIEENPNEDYVETYIRPVLQPVQEELVSGIYDRASSFAAEKTGRIRAETEVLFPIPFDGPSISAEQDVGIRRQAADLLTEKGVEATRENINRVSAQIREGNTELKILDAETARKLFDIASGTGEEKAENARRNALRQGFIIP